ncbi:MAG: RDD family protein [Gammaproteobacteria bacterium]|nr:RDD family protein [Gammaproteobacteria bacterium]MCW8924252.1 RDD family protein [Gammaproteobacteria bacterium]
MGNTNTQSSSFPAAKLLRRIMAIVYDLFLLAAILFLATALANAVNQGKAIDQNSPYIILLDIYLISISFLYFGWFWTHGGQTLGMKTWKIKLINNDSHRITWKQVLIREITAVASWLFFGLGFFWSVFDEQKRCWHDISSNSTLIDLRHTENQ